MTDQTDQAESRETEDWTDIVKPRACQLSSEHVYVNLPHVRVCKSCGKREEPLPMARSTTPRPSEERLRRIRLGLTLKEETR